MTQLTKTIQVQHPSDFTIIHNAGSLYKLATTLRNVCGIQANLLSTATVEEKNRFIELVFAAYNDIAAPIIDRVNGVK